MPKDTLDVRDCPDCGVAPGEAHERGCDVARCYGCGTQQLQCYDHEGLPMTLWTGVWPGIVECQEFGWYARWTVVSSYSRNGIPNTGDFISCPADHPHAMEDLNRLGDAEANGEIVWDRQRQRFVKPEDLSVPSGVGLYRKRPVVIEAVQLTDDADWEAIAAWCGAHYDKERWGHKKGDLNDQLGVPTLHGVVYASVGQWICKGPRDCWPVDEATFAETYEDC